MYGKITMDNRVYEIVKVCIESKAVVIASGTKVTRIPLFFLTSEGFRKSLRIEWI